MPEVVHHAVVAAISITVTPRSCSFDGRDCSAADQQAHQRGTDYGSGPMPGHNAHASAQPRSPSLPLSQDLIGGYLATRLRRAWLIRSAHHYLLLPSPRSGPAIPMIRWPAESGLRKKGNRHMG